MRTRHPNRTPHQITLNAPMAQSFGTSMKVSTKAVAWIIEIFPCLHHFWHDENLKKREFIGNKRKGMKIKTKTSDARFEGVHRGIEVNRKMYFFFSYFFASSYFQNFSCRNSTISLGSLNLRSLILYRPYLDAYPFSKCRLCSHQTDRAVQSNHTYREQCFHH